MKGLSPLRRRAMNGSASAGNLLNAPVHPGPKRQYMDEILGRNQASSSLQQRSSLRSLAKKSASNIPSPITEEDSSRIFKVKKVAKTKSNSKRMSDAVKRAESYDRDALEQDKKFYSDLKQKVGIDMQTTLESLHQMSRAILDQPELMEDAERADKMLLAAIHAKLEIMDLL